MLKVAKARIYLHKLACAAKTVKYQRAMEKIAKGKTDVTEPVGTGSPSLGNGVGSGITSDNTNVGIGNNVTQPVGTNTPKNVSNTGLLANGDTAALPAPDENGNIPPQPEWSITPRNRAEDEKWWMEERAKMMNTPQKQRPLPGVSNTFTPDQDRVDWWNSNTWLPMYNENGTQVNNPTNGTVNNGASRLDNQPRVTNMENFLSDHGISPANSSFKDSNAQRFLANPINTNRASVNDPSSRPAAYATPGTNVISYNTLFDTYKEPTVGEHESRHIMGYDMDYMAQQPYPWISTGGEPEPGVSSISGPDAVRSYLQESQTPYTRAYQWNFGDTMITGNYSPGYSFLESEIPTTMGEIAYYRSHPDSGYYGGYNDKIYAAPDKFSIKQFDRNQSLLNTKGIFGTSKSDDSNTVDGSKDSNFISDLISDPDFVPPNLKGATQFAPATPMRAVVDLFGNNSMGNAYGMWGGPENQRDGSWTFNPNIERMVQNVGQLPTAFDEAHANRGEYFATREAVQRAMDPLYAEFKPTGNSDPTSSYGETAQSPYTVRELLTMGTSGDPKQFEEAKKYSYMLRPDLRYLFDTNDAASMAENAGSYSNVMSILNSSKADITPEMEALQQNYSVTPGFDKMTDFRDMATMGNMMGDIQRGRVMRYGLDQMDAGSTDWLPMEYNGDGSEPANVHYETPEEREAYENQRLEREEEEIRMEEENRKAEATASRESNLLPVTDKVPNPTKSRAVSNSKSDKDAPAPFRQKREIPEFMKGYTNTSEEVPTSSLPKVDPETDNLEGGYGYDPTSSTVNTDGYDTDEYNVYGGTEGSSLHGGIGEQPTVETGSNLLGGIGTGGQYGHDPTSNTVNTDGYDANDYEVSDSSGMGNFHGGIGSQESFDVDRSGSTDDSSDYDPYAGMSNMDRDAEREIDTNGLLGGLGESDRGQNEEDLRYSRDPDFDALDAEISGFDEETSDADKDLDELDSEMYAFERELTGQDSEDTPFEFTGNTSSITDNRKELGEFSEDSDDGQDFYDMNSEIERMERDAKKLMRAGGQPSEDDLQKEVDSSASNEGASQTESEFQEGDILNTMNDEDRASYDRMKRSLGPFYAKDIMRRRLQNRRDANKVKNSPYAEHHVERDANGNVISEGYSGTLVHGEVVPTSRSSKKRRPVKDTSGPSRGPDSSTSADKSVGDYGSPVSGGLPEGRQYSDDQIRNMGNPVQQFRNLSGEDLVAAFDMNREAGYWGGGVQNMPVKDIVETNQKWLDMARQQGKLTDEQCAGLQTRLLQFLSNEAGREEEVQEYYAGLRGSGSRGSKSTSRRKSKPVSQSRGEEPVSRSKRDSRGGSSVSNSSKRIPGGADFQALSDYDKQVVKAYRATHKGYNSQFRNEDMPMIRAWAESARGRKKLMRYTR